MTPAKVDFVVGTGGIGSGILFKLIGEHDLGRNETRLAELTDYKDYCKLHIILNYVAAFSNGSIPVYAIGAVGDDTIGNELLELMSKKGIDIRYVDIDAQSGTMYSVCYQYPNGEGGNITTQNSACDKVSQRHVFRFFNEVKPSKHGIVLSAPEVPVETRLYLLKKGRELGCYNVASLLVGEARQFALHHAFEMIDLLAVNRDEALAIANLESETDVETTGESVVETDYETSDKTDGDTIGETDCDTTDENIADRCYSYLKSKNPDICVIVTCGGEGAYTYHAGQKWFTPAVKNTVRNTAGAGDCFLGTVISALIHSLPLTQDVQDDTVSSAVKLALLCGAMKIACNDTIDFSIDKQLLLRFAKSKEIPVSDLVMERFFHSDSKSI